MRPQVYFNDPQLHCQLIGANTSVIVAGRRTGKTDGLAAPFVLKNVQRLRGGTGGIVVPTFKHGLTNTLPGLFAALKRYGYIRGVHYVIGRKPPKGFGKPIIEPTDFEHVISFWNGSCAVLISQDRPGSSNSLTLSWLLIDEAKFIDYEKLKNETLPANGGNKAFFGAHSCNHAIMILSDMPQTSRGSWFMSYREKSDPQVIEAIEAQIVAIYDLRNKIAALNGKPVPQRWLSELRCLDRDLNRLRSVAVYYREYSSIENVELLGENYIKQMKRDLTPKTFQTSILCRRLGLSKDGFYSSMTERNLYDASNFEYLDSLGFDADSAAMDCRADADVNSDKPIYIAFDYNANINWLVAAQVDGSVLKIIKSFYVKYQRKLPELVDDFVNYYKWHRCRKVHYVYDSTAIGSNYAVNDRDFAYVIRERFEHHGWMVNDVYIGNPMPHAEKYLLINQSFTGRQKLTLMINRQNNEDLLIAINSAGIIRGSKGFRKDKGGEKIEETEENLLEHRTDGTDAFDTVYIGAERFTQSDITVALGPDII